MLEIFGIAGLGMAILVPLFLIFLSIKKPPTWLKDGPLENNWKKINIGSLAFSYISSILAAIVYIDYGIHVTGTAVLMSALLGFVSFQSFFTDLWQRYADRRILRICNIIAGIFGTFFIVQVFGIEMLPIYGILFLAASVLIYIPKIGASDGRAMQLAVLASIPVVGLLGFQYGIIGFLAFLTIFGIGNAIYRKDLKQLVKKVSTPMVPMILLPFLIVILAYDLLV